MIGRRQAGQCRPRFFMSNASIFLSLVRYTPEGEVIMRFMMIVKASKDSEAGVMPSEEILSAMGKYNEQLMKAGVLLDLAGLQSSSKGARIKFSGGKRTVIDGPFAETKELIAGYWIIQVNSREEAIEWAKRVPAPHGEGQEVKSRSASFSSWTTLLPATRWTARANSARRWRRERRSNIARAQIAIASFVFGL